MALPRGKYIIGNQATRSHLGRALHEDASSGPKPIVTLPEEIQPPIWRVEPLGNDRYVLEVSKPPSRESYVAAIDEKVFAILGPGPPPTEWTIKRVEDHGPNVYIVEAPFRKVWTVPHRRPGPPGPPEENVQVVLDTIIVFESAQDGIPYSPTQLFTFHPIFRDEA